MNNFVVNIVANLCHYGFFLGYTGLLLRGDGEQKFIIGKVGDPSKKPTKFWAYVQIKSTLPRKF